MSYKDKDIVSVHVREDLIRELDIHILGFRNIAWQSRSKRFKSKDAKTIKYELVVLIADCYWGHELKHKDDGSYYSLYYKTLLDKLGKDYRKHIDTVFDIIGGVTISSAFRKDGSTQKYKLKEKVLDICEDVFRRSVKMHSLVNRTGSIITEWEEYAVSKTNENGEFQKKVDNKKYKFSPKVKLNKNNATLLTHMFSDLYGYKTGRLKEPQVRKWTDILKSIDADINDGRRWSGERLQDLHKNSMEIYSQMMIDIIGDGYVGQLYKERNTGRLFGIGGCNLQGMMREQRRILMGGLGYYEYDMENAHYSIISQYYNIISGNKLSRIDEYINDTKGYRNRLVNETGSSYETIKECLLAMIYGASITRRIVKIDGVLDDTGIWEKINKQTTDRKVAQELWNAFTNHNIVKELHTDVGRAYDAIKETWVVSNHRNIRKVKNVMNKTRSTHYKVGDKDYKEFSMGKLLSHFLQGIEARILLGVIIEEGKGVFIMPHHDGWVSRQDWDTDVLQQLIEKDTRKMLWDYNQIKGSFQIKIKKVELTNVIDGDWSDVIIKKGVVSSLH